MDSLLEKRFLAALDLIEKGQHEEAVKELFSLSEESHIEAMILSADACLKGIGCEKDFQQAEYYLKAASEAGSLKAQELLEILYKLGDLATEQDIYNNYQG